MNPDDDAGLEVDAPPAEPVLTPEDRKREEMRAIATSGSTFITTEPTQQLRFFEYLRMVDKKDIISGWDNVIDEDERRTMLSHLKRAVSMVAPLAAKGDEKEFVKLRDRLLLFFQAVLPQYDPQVQVNALEMELSFWIDKTSFGVPPRVPEGVFDYDPNVVFQKVAPKIASEVSRRILQP